MSENHDFAISSLNKLSYTSSSLGVGSLAGYLLQNKELIFIALGILGGVIGFLTYLTSLYFQIKRDRRDHELFKLRLSDED